METSKLANELSEKIMVKRALENTYGKGIAPESVAALLNLVRHVRAWFDNEANYPEGTAGYRIAQQARAVIALAEIPSQPQNENYSKTVTTSTFKNH